MKKICLSKLQFLLLALLVTALAGCGANNAGIANNAGDGVAKAVLVYGTKDTAKKTASLVTVPPNVAKVQFTVTGTGTGPTGSGPIGALPVVSSTVATTGGTITGLYPGTVTVAAQAFDSTGAVVFEGFARNAVITSGNPTNVGTIYMTAPIVKANEAVCLGCHANALDATGQNIVGGYKQSGHYSNTSFQDVSSATMPFFNKIGTGCAGCHGPQHNVGDPSALGSGRSGALATSVASTRCFDCHNVANANAPLVANHDTLYLANGTQCSACHQLHDTQAADQERNDWMASGHGSTSFGGLNHNSGACIRCHNGKGFQTALANPLIPVVGSPAQQQITCDACHSNAPLGVLRQLAGASATQTSYSSSSRGYPGAPFNLVNPAKKPFPDVSGSNLCIVCHCGSWEGTSTVAATSDPYFVASTLGSTITNTTSYIAPSNSIAIKTIAPHNLPSAAVMYVKFGFTNLSTGSGTVPSAAYLKSLTADLDIAGGITSTHRQLGTPAINGNSHNPSVFVPGFLDSNGPCATCHLTGSHSLQIDDKAVSAVCNNCHTSENGNSLVGPGQFQANFLNPQVTAFNATIELAAAIINAKNAAYVAGGGTTQIRAYLDSNNKLTFDNGILGSSTTITNTGATLTKGGSITSWPVVAKALGYSTVTGDLGQIKFLGALSNLVFLSEDQGAIAHAHTYTRRLIYDSIDFLDDGVLNGSVSNTALAVSAGTVPYAANVITSGFSSNPAAGLFKRGINAYNTQPSGSSTTISSLYTNTSQAMTTLIAFNRTTGVWTSGSTPGIADRP